MVSGQLPFACLNHQQTGWYGWNRGMGGLVVHGWTRGIGGLVVHGWIHGMGGLGLEMVK